MELKEFVSDIIFESQLEREKALIVAGYLLGKFDTDAVPHKDDIQDAIKRLGQLTDFSNTPIDGHEQRLSDAVQVTHYLSRLKELTDKPIIFPNTPAE